MADWFNILRENGIDIPELEEYQTDRDNREDEPILVEADEVIDALVVELVKDQTWLQAQEHINRGFATAVLAEARKLKVIAQKMGARDE